MGNYHMHILTSADDMECEDDEDSLEDDASLDNVLKDVADALLSKKIERSVRLLKDALEKFCGAEVLW